MLTEYICGLDVQAQSRDPANLSNPEVPTHSALKSNTILLSPKSMLGAISRTPGQNIGLSICGILSEALGHEQWYVSGGNELFPV